MSFADLADDVLVACRDTFGQTVSYTPQATGVPVEIEAVFDSAYEEITVQAETGVPISTRRPILGVRLADLALAPRVGDGVEVESVAYDVVDVQPDGVGVGVTLRLVKA